MPVPGLRRELDRKIEKVFEEDREEHDTLRWRVEVPIVTNLFLLVDFVRFVLVMMAVVFVMAAIPQWIYASDVTGLTKIHLMALLRLSLTGGLVFAGCVFFVGFFLLRNRFRAAFVLDGRQVYYETSAVKRSGIFFHWRPRPVDGGASSIASLASPAPRAFVREVPWEKMNAFISFPPARTILLKRGMWEILKLYTPDAATHARAEAFLSKRLREKK